MWVCGKARPILHGPQTGLIGEIKSGLAQPLDANGFRCGPDRPDPMENPTGPARPICHLIMFFKLFVGRISLF